MIGLDLAIRQLAFAQARTSIAEAMMIMAGHQQEVERATGGGGVSAEQEAEHFSELAQQLRTSGGGVAAEPKADEGDHVPLVDKLA
jgi:hypothetical protein